MNLTTNVKGQIALGKTELRAIELGYLPSKPVFDCRYDLILDKDNKLWKVQVKYADAKSSNSSGVVMVKLGYTNRKRQTFTYQAGEVDVLIVYIPRVDCLCFLPPSVFLGKVKLYIRYVPSKNNQQKGIISAQDYLW